MKRAVGLALALTMAVPQAWAKGDEDEEASDEEVEEDEEEEEQDTGDAAPAAKGKDATKEPEDEEDDENPSGSGLKKQNLTGHDLGTKKRSNEFEKDRFFVDKVDTEKTEEGTLVQGSLSSSSFLYAEKGGNYGGTTMPGSNAGPMRLFTELRLQTDFRHIKASRWEARIDTRARVVNSTANGVNTDPNNLQSGLTGKNEYDIRELWLIRSGERSDVFIGRQFVPDLGGIKFDGLRVDYAKSAKFTVIGFGGLYPLRGSRSVETDYMRLKTEDGNSAGRFVSAGGGGAAYRTVNMYGALGGVALVPLSRKEQPRIYATSNGYYRSGSKLDFYHFGLVDIVGSAGFALTNVSAGVNIKPNPRLRITMNAHRVSTETLNVHAGAFLSGEDTTVDPATMVGGNKVIQNEAYINRLSTNQARVGVSAGLGKQQRFEVSTALTYRLRPELTLQSPDPTAPVIAVLPAASSVEVWGGIADRHSIKDTRIALDGSRTFRVGDVSFQRSESLIVRASANRALAEGRGEWEAEVWYSTVKDSIIGMPLSCTSATVPDCYGASNSGLISAGGQLFYRLKRDWFGIATLHVLRITNRRAGAMGGPAPIDDPAVYGLTSFLRIAKRF